MEIIRKKVLVTHFVNPNLFYLFDTTRVEEFKAAKRLEEGYGMFCALRQGSFDIENIKENQLYCYFSNISQKWLRCEVDEVRETKHGKAAIMWATDYGIPFSTNKSENLVPLPNENRLVEAPIFRASLEILPSQSFINFSTTRLEKRLADSWSDKNFLAAFRNVVIDAKNVYFEPSRTVFDSEITFGELILETKDGQYIELSRYVVQNGPAIRFPPEKFMSMYNRTLASVLQRWDDNERSGGVMKFFDIVRFPEMDKQYNKENPICRYVPQAIANDIDYSVNQEIRKSIVKVHNWQIQNSAFKQEEPDTIDLTVDYPIPANLAPLPLPLNMMNRERLTGQPGHSRFHSLASTQSSHSSSYDIPKQETSAYGGARANPLAYNGFVKMVNAAPGPSKDAKEEPSTSAGLLSTFKACTNMERIFERLEGNRTKWMGLELDAEYEVTVCNFDDGNSFFIQVVNKFDRWDEMMNILDNLKAVRPMVNIREGKMCLVDWHDELNRAMITHHSDVFTACFGVDTGATYFFYNTPLQIYEISTEILNFMPFQVVNCRFSGIEVSSNQIFTSLINNKVIRRICEQRLRVVETLEGNPSLSKWLEHMNCYEVVIFERKPDGVEVNVNDTLKKLRLTV